jgi:hypothetical protein
MIYPSKRIEWLEAISRLYTYYTAKTATWQRQKPPVEALVLEYPTDVQYYEKAAMLSGELKDYKSAVFYFKKAFDLAPYLRQSPVSLRHSSQARSAEPRQYRI